MEWPLQNEYQQRLYQPKTLKKSIQHRHLVSQNLYECMAKENTGKLIE